MSKNCESRENHSNFFFNCENRTDSEDFPAPIYDIKIVARPVDTIRDIIRSLSLAQSVLKVPKCANLAHREAKG